MAVKAKSPLPTSPASEEVLRERSRQLRAGEGIPYREFVARLRSQMRSRIPSSGEVSR